MHACGAGGDQRKVAREAQATHIRGHRHRTGGDEAALTTVQKRDGLRASDDDVIAVESDEGCGRGQCRRRQHDRLSDSTKPEVHELPVGKHGDGLAAGGSDIDDVAGDPEDPLAAVIEIEGADVGAAGPPDTRENCIDVVNASCGCATSDGDTGPRR